MVKSMSDAMNSVFTVLNMCKGFEIARGGSKDGVMLVKIDDQLYKMKLTELVTTESGKFSDDVEKYSYLLK